MPLFADVLVPFPLSGRYCYEVPTFLEKTVARGLRVVVPFGARKIVTAVIFALHHNRPKHYQTKYISEVLEDEPSVNEKQFAFWEWLNKYYLCHLGEVMAAALPAGLKLSSESYVQPNPDCLPAYLTDLSDKEEKVLTFVRQKQSATFREIQNMLKVKDASRHINSLIKRRAVFIHEKIKEKYAPKRIKQVSLHKRLEDADTLKKTFDDLEKRSPRQLEILLQFLAQQKRLNTDVLEKSTLMSGLSASAYKTLLQKEILCEQEVQVSHLSAWAKMTATDTTPLHTLSDRQKSALEAVLSAFGSGKNTVLLHGVTGSGKTLIYAHLIKSALEGGGQVLMLVPEIVLTAQIVSRLKRFFGKEMGVYHSRFSEKERVEVWENVRSGECRFVLGVRSAIFLPFSLLGLIVVDEAHDSSYKQQNPAPRYHARDAAAILAKIHTAKLLLGSATPAVESYYLASRNRFGLVTLNQRFGETALPKIHFADLKKHRKKKQMYGIFTASLREKMEEVLAAGKKIILFRNRRGYAPYLSCAVCDWIPECKHCAVSLTYHLKYNELRCHYCGYSQNVPHRCAACGAHKILTVGAGTEKIENEVAFQFPKAKIGRIDQDTARKKYGYQQIINDFAGGKIDILVGTQMISKGLDFEKVGLVGVLGIDNMLHYPDFRANERAFQLLTQVSGRAGREQQGEVIIQTKMPKHPLLQQLIAQDYHTFYQAEIEERKQYNYPPFSRLMRITLKHPDEKKVGLAAADLAQLLTPWLGKKRILGPETPIIGKIKNLFLQEMLVKLERNLPKLEDIKQEIWQKTISVAQKKEFKPLRIVLDVDCL